jgi:hypothetical protein
MGVRRIALPEPVQAARIGKVIHIAESVPEEDVPRLLKMLDGGRVVVVTADRRLAAEEREEAIERARTETEEHQG